MNIYINTEYVMEFEISGLHLRNKKNTMRVGKKRVFKTTEMRGYEQDLKDAILSQWRGALMEGPLKVDVRIQFPDRRRRDIANYLDALFDVMNGLVYADDSQIVEIHAYKSIGKVWNLKVAVEDAAEDTRLLSDLRK
jgi:Holliday junction resolvase RusA-like endonuclease